MANFKSLDEKTRQAFEMIEQGVKDVYSSESFKRYLSCLSKFHSYSLNNTLLILTQKPDASLVAGYRSWQINFNRHVDKGEKGLMILAPVTYKEDRLMNKVDENGNALKGAKFEQFKQNEDSTWKSLGEQAGTGTDENKFAWSGLDDGIYKLVETKVPDGYNKLDDQIFTVTGTHDSESDDPKLTDLTGNVTTGTITFDKNVTNGSLSTKVENRSGSLLPSTGGIGTTIFYVVGVVLMLGAGVLLITKRRMSAKH